MTVNKDVLLAVSDESIVPFRLEGMASAVCVAGSYQGDNTFRLTVCVTVVLKVLAKVEILIPSYGFCPIPPCEEFADAYATNFQPAAFPAVHPVRRKRRQRESGQQLRLLLRVPAEYRQLTPENKGRGSLRPLPAFICFFPAPAGTAFCPARRCSRPIVRRPPRPGGRGSRWAADFARWRRLPPGRPGDSPCGRPAGRR